MKKADKLLKLIDEELNQSKEDRTKEEMEKGLKFWVLDWVKAVIVENKDMIDRTSAAIKDAIKEKDLDKDLVFNYFGDPKDSDFRKKVEIAILRADLPGHYQL